MVAQNERFGTEMISVVVGGRMIAVDADDQRAQYAVAQRLHASQPAGREPGGNESARALVEIQRQHGGLAPRAVLGGEFIAGGGAETVFEVLVSPSFETLTANDGKAPTFPGRLHRGWPFTAGLPEEFAPAALRGASGESCSIGLPPGLLRIDRAGFDERESASPAFELAGRMLRCVLAVELQGGDVESELRRLIPLW